MSAFEFVDDLNDEPVRHVQIRLHENARLRVDILRRQRGICPQHMRQRLLGHPAEPALESSDEDPRPSDVWRRATIVGSRSAGETTFRCGRSTRRSVVGLGAVTMKMMSNTKSTSMNGITFGSAVGASRVTRLRAK